MRKVKLAELDQEALIDKMIHQLDDLPWEKVGESEDATVYLSSAIDCPFDGFKTITLHDAEPIKIARYLGKNIVGAMGDMNHLSRGGSIIREIYDKGDEDYYAIARTLFKMPFPLQDREFLHTLYVKRRDKNTAFIVYHSIFDDDLPPEEPGYLRCPTYLSGQRITSLPGGKTQVEHMMIYGLAGRIGPWVQNKLFKKGHIDAYLKEWGKFCEITKTL